jgi:DNA primase
MKNLKLLQLLETVLGKGKPTSGDNIAFFSPFTSHYKPKLEININTNADGDNPWHCWISDNKGRTIYTLFKSLNQPKEKFEQLARIIQTTRYRVEKQEKRDTVLQLPEEYHPMWIYKKSYEYNAAMHYLKGRGVTVFDIIKYRIGYAEEGQYAKRIIIPSYDSSGSLNYFVSRIYRDREGMKHKNPTVSKDIIGFEMMINWREPIVLCEGSFDAIAIKRNSIPLFGKIIQPELQKKIIEEHVRDIYICLDADALKNALDIAERFMNEGLNVYFVVLQDKDASELGFETIIKRISETMQMSFEDLMMMRMGMLWT